MAPGEGCATQCGEGMVHCGGECLVGGDVDVCCVGSTGNGILCNHDSICCDGLCAADHTACNTQACATGMIPCGGDCLAGEDGDTCCTGPSGHGIVCGAGALCCDGLCVVNGTGCASPCGEGLISCGGQCQAANLPGSTCCQGPYGGGMVCGP